MKAVEKFDNDEVMQRLSKNILKSKNGRDFAKDVDSVVSDLAKKYDITEKQVKTLLLDYSLA